MGSLETPSGSDAVMNSDLPIEKTTDDDRLDPAPEPTGEDPGQQPPDPLAAVTAERDDFRDKLLRLHAEMENSRKRSQREREEERRYAVLPLARDLLPSLDNLRRAMEAGEKSGPDNGELLQGLRMVAAQIEEVLGRHGVTPIPALGLPFDPNLHEALQQVPSAEHPPMTVILEYERGFKLHDRVIRPAKVVVSAAAST